MNDIALTVKYPAAQSGLFNAIQWRIAFGIMLLALLAFLLYLLLVLLLLLPPPDLLLLF